MPESPDRRSDSQAELAGQVAALLGQARSWLLTPTQRADLSTIVAELEQPSTDDETPRLRRAKGDLTVLATARGWHLGEDAARAEPQLQDRINILLDRIDGTLHPQPVGDTPRALASAPDPPMRRRRRWWRPWRRP